MFFTHEITRRAMSMLVGLALLGGCAALPVDTGNDAVRFNELQFIGSHNSYKQAIDPELLAVIAAGDGALAASLDYAHIGLGQQLDLGLRNLELDVFYDPAGGRFAEPLGMRMITSATPYDSEVMQRPGFKVMHVQDIDFRSHCPLLADCLALLAEWSARNPEHLPVVITLNAKDAMIARAGFTAPLAFDAAAWNALDQTLRDGLGERLFEPDELRGGHSTLPDAVTSGWPAAAQMRGRLLFVLDESGAKLTSYIDGHPALRGRAMFVNAPIDSAEAAVLIMNDPRVQFEEIAAAVRRGYIVRTRADADTLEARNGDYSRMRKAFASGAQVITTDYYQPEPRFGHEFHVRFPQGGFLRCNPQLRSDCPENVEGGALLTGTTWRLLEFVSMDDAIGRITPPADSVYTLRLQPDGTLQLQLNCNRGRGTWQAEAAAGERLGVGTDGGLRFGRLAVTKAFCPPPNMDDQFVRDLGYVRSFVIRQGNLYLSLYADGGIYRFEPQ